MERTVEVHLIEHNVPQCGQLSSINQEILEGPPTSIQSYESYKNKELLMTKMKTQPVLMRKKKRRLVNNPKVLHLPYAKVKENQSYFKMKNR